MSRWRGVKKNVIKGPVFPSFVNTRSSLASPRQRMIFLPHTRHRAATRNLKNACAQALKLHDVDSFIARERCRAAVAGEPFPEYAFYHLVHAAWEAHDGTGCPWHEAMTYLLDKFDAEKAEQHLTGTTRAFPATNEVEDTANEQSVSDSCGREDQHEQDQHGAQG